MPGQPALSNFRVAKLTHALRCADERVKDLEARFVYFVTINTELSRQDRARLDALLLSGDKPGKLSKAARHLYVVPRLPVPGRPDL